MGLHSNSVVKFLGAYHFRNGDQKLPRDNIILEYGDRDLDEFLAENYPPIFTSDIVAYWEELFTIVDMLKHLHKLEYKGQNFFG